jgi:prepilin-type N-terminal cleavage/methylation domain-containing protein
MKKEGFTLVELLAVIVILAVILAIAIPSISSMLKNTTRSAFESDAKMLLKQVEYARLNNSSFDPTTINTSTLSNFNLSSNNYDSLGIIVINDEPYIFILGKNKWTGYKACGTSKNIEVVSMNDNITCKVDFPYTGNYQNFKTPMDGTYKIELWGAQGGGIGGGAGGYTSGNIKLNASEMLYVYVGGTTLNGTGGYNGGGNITNNVYGGGGATDVRLSFRNWNDVTSLRSRIMVAAGGGGYNTNTSNAGGYGGGLAGASGLGEGPGIGATQTLAGGPSNTIGRGAGDFGIGGNGSWCNEPIGGGGAGYYGGSSGSGIGDNGSGGGGSSFISGCAGCDAIDASGVHTGQSNHFSGKVFTNMQMIDGNSSMPNPSGGTEIGNSGSGYARITYIGN